MAEKWYFEWSDIKKSDIFKGRPLIKERLGLMEEPWGTPRERGKSYQGLLRVTTH